MFICFTYEHGVDRGMAVIYISIKLLYVSYLLSTLTDCAFTSFPFAIPSLKSS